MHELYRNRYWDYRPIVQVIVDCLFVSVDYSVEAYENMTLRLIYS